VNRKYKVQGSSRQELMGIEINLVLEDDSIGTEIKVLGGTFSITQNGPILVLVNPDWCLTLQDITPEETKVPSLVINKNLEIFFETKEILIGIKCTYEELFNVLKSEWNLAGKLMKVSLPFEYNQELKLFTFKDEWNFSQGSLQLMTAGSYSRIDKSGRNI